MRLGRLPIRARLVVGFVGAMVVVLIAAGAFVFWRVQYALDRRLNQDLATQSADLHGAAMRLAPAAALRSLRDEAREAQLLRADGSVLVSGPGIEDDRPLITPTEARRARHAPLRTGRGYLFSKPGRHLRILAVPVRGEGAARIAVVAVRLGQRDEALSELLVQLAIAHALALALASAVGYWLARRALDPVESYRTQAEQIAQGATGVRLEVPEGPSDEISRLGATLNDMLDAQQSGTERQQQFIDDASHELRTPLSALSAEIDLALRKPRTASEYEATLQRVATDAGQLVELAETLLALGSLGVAAPPSEEMSASGVLHAAAGRARGQLDRDDRAVLVRVGEDALTVRGNRALLDRALGNLVDNAVHHGRGTIVLSADRMPGDSLVLAVHDEGTELDPDFLPHAAERFRQAASSRTGSGAGLGLALVDGIARAHGGQLRVCAGDHHHRQPTPTASLQRLDCLHPSHGTTVALILPASNAGRP